MRTKVSRFIRTAAACAIASTGVAVLTAQRPGPRDVEALPSRPAEARVSYGGNAAESIAIAGAGHFETIAPTPAAWPIVRGKILQVPGTRPAIDTPDPKLLQGAWTSGGPSFDMVIKERTILFEFDMKEHPYRLERDVIVIDFQDPTLGVQRKRILKLSQNELEIQDEPSGTRALYRRMQDEPSSRGPRAGIAVTSAGRCTLAMAGPALQVGSMVTLIAIGKRQESYTAVVTRRLSESAIMATHDVTGPYYDLASEGGRELPNLAVAVPGRPAVRRLGNTISLRLGRQQPDVQVRSCTSREGAHLTLWAGTPLKAPRLWHAYFYLGYDVEMDCTPADYREDGRELQKMPPRDDGRQHEAVEEIVQSTTAL